MTMRPQPNNATPQRLQLAPQNVPRMPFSSPMGEEVLSPTSPNASRSPPQHQIKLSQSQGGQENAAENEWALPSQRPAAGDKRRSQDEGDHRSRWPGLNVVTNFAKAPSLRQRAAEGGAKQNAGLGLKKQQRGSIATSRKASIETLGLGHQPSDRSLKTLGSKGRLGELKRASSKWSNLSPSDRAVVIGISVSPEELAHHSASPEASPARSGGLSEQHAIDRRSATMPSIVITPAKEKAPWSADEEPAQLHESRVPSSVYSHVPPHTGVRTIDSAMVPPLPPLPPDAQGHNTQNKTRDPTKKGPPPRIVSNLTEIDESESKETDDEKANGSGRSQLKVLTKRASMDTIATRHRSQGWWNHIVSPFFPKSPMTFKAPQEPVPGIPTSIHQDQSLQEARQTFPPPPKSDGLRSSRTSWTDSTLDAEYDQRLELDGFGERSTMIVDEPQESLMRESALLPATFEGFGAAAEYYEACLYDAHSETPYFECQNHVCLSSKSAKLVGSGNESPRFLEHHAGPGEKAGTGQISGPTLAAQQAPTNRFSAAFHEAINPKQGQRPKSDTTVIEDLETTPDVHEARAAPVVRAPVPILAAQPSAPRNLPESEIVSFKTPVEPPIASEPPPRASPARVESPALPSGSPLRQSSTAEYLAHPTTSTPRLNPASVDSPIRQERQPKRYVAVLPPENRSKSVFEQPLSPEPLSPGQQRQAPKDAILLEDVRSDGARSHGANDNSAENLGSGDSKREQTIVTTPFAAPQDLSRIQALKSTTPSEEASRVGSGSQHGFEPPLRRRDYQDHERQQTTVADLYPPPRNAGTTQRSWQCKEKDALPPREPKKHQPFAFPKCKSCFDSAKPRNKKERKIIIAIGIGLILLVILTLVLAMTLTLKRKGHNTPVQAQWLNLTNLPPIPTGIATIIQPDAVNENPDCIHPETMWSCAVPKEEQQNLLPNAPNQPNFRVEIVFQNGTNATANSTFDNSSSIHRRSYGHIPNAVSAGSFIKNRLLYVRDTFSGTRFTPSPAAPNLEEQNFLGNTTDRNALPFDGEFTPFFMSFESASKLSSRLHKRKDSDSEDDTNPFPNSTDGIPPPDTTPNGTAAPANLYPYPSYQPLRLYDRGLDTEHYGFYSYFDRSIFLKSALPLDPSANNDTTPVPDDQDGGANKNAASVRCTWAQTRFLVQIWTKKGSSATLLQSSNYTSTSSQPTSSDNATEPTSSANDFAQPGSFPYPITISLDRHGGDITKKMVYCYGLDDRERYDTSRRQFQLEDRGVGGQLVNPALGPFGNVNVTGSQGGPGGIDGGSGGCACRWRNFGTGI